MLISWSNVVWSYKAVPCRLARVPSGRLVITKNRLVTRDADLLGELAGDDAAGVLSRSRRSTTILWAVSSAHDPARGSAEGDRDAGRSGCRSA